MSGKAKIGDGEIEPLRKGCGVCPQEDLMQTAVAVSDTYYRSGMADEIYQSGGEGFVEVWMKIAEFASWLDAEYGEEWGDTREFVDDVQDLTLEWQRHMIDNPGSWSWRPQKHFRSWDLAPDWARYAAVDADGKQFWYEFMPTLSEGYWSVSGGQIMLADPWVGKLEERPES